VRVDRAALNVILGGMYDDAYGGLATAPSELQCTPMPYRRPARAADGPRSHRVRAVAPV